MRLLLVAIVCEMALFSAVAPHFLSAGNFIEVARFSVELGLVAVAMTPVIVTGGIDLSVGAMMGLAAVVFGVAATTAPIPVAALFALLVGVAGGIVNACAVAWLGIPALVATLATMSLFRGVAEGVTEGAISYSGFSPGFLFLGQGYLAGAIPSQLPCFSLRWPGSVCCSIDRSWAAPGMRSGSRRPARVMRVFPSGSE